MSAPNPDESLVESSGDYGETIPLDASGDMQTNELARLSSMSGPQVVIQRLKVAFLTPEGSSPMAPNFGFDWFVIGEPREVVEAELRRTVESDPDVLRVADLWFEEPEPDPPEERPWPIAHISVELTQRRTPIDFTVELSNIST